ncbi:MAG: hypothetical protein HOF76_02095 [Candidatus Scalindua sp.]|jgi:hypothetical protein|nr:hypothetical protein [Candidatus Scalindua sp.]MBT7592112.1 hypothetical protein [Candidatus Scalindua sp.]
MEKIIDEKGKVLHNGFFTYVTLDKLKEIGGSLDWDNFCVELEEIYNKTRKESTEELVVHNLEYIDKINKVDKGSGVGYCLPKIIEQYEKMDFVLKGTINLLVEIIKAEVEVNPPDDETLEERKPIVDDLLLNILNKRSSNN